MTKYKIGDRVILNEHFDIGFDSNLMITSFQSFEHTKYWEDEWELTLVDSNGDIKLSKKGNRLFSCWYKEDKFQLDRRYYRNKKIAHLGE